MPLRKVVSDERAELSEKITDLTEAKTETAKKIDLYEKRGVVITENNISDAVSKIDSLRAKLAKEREERSKRNNSRKTL